MRGKVNQNQLQLKPHMSIAFYRWNDTDAAIKARLLRRAQAQIDDVVESVRPIIADVKARPGQVSYS